MMSLSTWAIFIYTKVTKILEKNKKSTQVSFFIIFIIIFFTKLYMKTSSALLKAAGEDWRKYQQGILLSSFHS